MALLWRILVLLLSCCSRMWALNLYGPCSTLPATSCTTRQGVIVIGGFFPVHEWNFTNGNCSAQIRPSAGLQRLEAARWALENLTSGMDFITNALNIGYDLRDSCSWETIIRDQALDFINIGTNCRPEYLNRPISMVLGASSSELSVDLTNLLTLFRIPHISYSASADRLSSSDNSLFYRTVPPDTYQVDAIRALMDRFNWSYVSIIYSNDVYGNDAHRRFMQLEAGSEGFDFCLAASVSLDIPTSANAINSALDQIVLNNASTWHRNASVVILFMEAPMARQVLQRAFDRQDIGHVTFIGSDALSGNAYALRNLPPSSAFGLITLEPRLEDSSDVNSFLSEFENRVRGQFPAVSWYEDYFKALFPNCSSFTAAPCSLYRVRDSGLYRADTKLASVIRAADIAMRAIDSAIRTACNGTLTNCSAVLLEGDAINGTKINLRLPHVSFDGISYHSGSRSFIGNSNGYRYTIRNLVMSNASLMAVGRRLAFEEIGSWNSTSGLTLTKMPVFRSGAVSVPSSRCAEECSAGQFRSVLRTDQQCCWSCMACPAHHFSSSTNATACTRCPVSMQANSDKTSCVELPRTYVGFRSALGIFITSLACLGIVATAIIAGVFYQHVKTPLVVASSRELSSCLFGGFFISCLVVFAFFAEPSAYTCGIQRFGLGFSLSLCFAALLVKTNRISRIFNRKVGVGRPKYTTPGYQLLFTALFVFIEVSHLHILMIFRGNRIVRTFLDGEYIKLWHLCDVTIFLATFRESFHQHLPQPQCPVQLQ